MSWNVLKAFSKEIIHEKTGGGDNHGDGNKKQTSPGTILRLWNNAITGLTSKQKSEAVKEVTKKLDFEDDLEDTAHETEEKRRSADKAAETFQRLQERSKVIMNRPGGWDNMRKNVNESRRKYLEEELRMNSENPSLAHVVKLAHNCLESKHHTSDAAYSGALLMEWAIFRGFQVTPAEMVLLARAHAEVWLARGMAAERYHLERAKVLFEGVLRPTEEFMESAVPWIDYARVLQNMGNRKAAIGILQHVVTSFEGDPEIPNYLFYIGAMLKSEGLFDEASNYFFEATQSGPPRFFSKLDMMFIISRNIDEEGSLTGEPNEEAYEMVFTHLKMEGLVSEELSYEEWLCDSKTWRMLGDKCALHGMFSLATDLYAQGLMKDTDSFRKPKLWFAFAKACYRCNRESDAQLAVKQALTMDPYNQQLLRANEICNTVRHEFEDFLETDLVIILDRLHKHDDHQERGRNKFQALVRGKSTRKGFFKATGSRSDITKRMRCMVGVLLGGQHPIILTADASWLGTVSNITATSVYGETAQLKLQHPFTPPAEATTHPRKLKLTLQATSDEKMHVDRHVLKLRFEDTETGQYIEREMTLSFREHDASGKLLHVVSKGQTEDDLDDEDRKLAAEGVHARWTLLDSLRFHDARDTVTDIAEIVVEKGCFITDQRSYMYSVSNENKDTVVNILQVSTDRRVEYRMPREHIDRSRALKKYIKMLFEASLRQPIILEAFYPGMPAETNVGVIEIASINKKIRLNIVQANCLSVQGLVVEVKETSGSPVLATHFETVVPHVVRPITDEEIKQMETDENLGLTSLTKLRLKRVASQRQTRKAQLLKKVNENPDEFDYSGLDRPKTVKFEAHSEENSVMSGLRDAFVPGMDKEGANIHTELHLSKQKDAEPLSPKRQGVVNTHQSSKEIKTSETAGETSKMTSTDADEDEVSVLSQDSALEDSAGMLGDTSMTPKVDAEEDNPIDAAQEEEGGDESEEEEEAGKKKVKKDGKKKKNKKARDKEARDKARKSAMKARLEQSGGLGALHFMGDEEDEEAKKKDREEKKRIQREKMALEKAKLLALAAERKAKQAAGPVAAEAVKEESPKKKKKAQKKAALDATVFLKHQEARLEASEYLLHRARALKVSIGKDECGKWLLQAAIRAKGRVEEIEDQERLEAALAEAEGAKKRAKTPMLNVTSKVMKSKGKFKRAQSRKGISDASNDDDDTVTAVETEASQELPVVTDTPTENGEPQSNAEYQAEETQVDPTEQPVNNEVIAEEVAIPLYVKPKKPTLSRYPVFKKPVVQRQRVGKIEMHHKPSLSNRQKQRLLRPLEPSDLPPSAFASAEGLLAALRAHYDLQEAAVVPAVSEPPQIETPATGDNGNDAVVDGAEALPVTTAADNASTDVSGPVEENKNAENIDAPQAAVLAVVESIAVVTSPVSIPSQKAPLLPVDYFDAHSLINRGYQLTEVSAIVDPHVERFRQIRIAEQKRLQERNSMKATSREFAANPFEPVRVPNNLAFLDFGLEHANSAQIARDGVHAYKTRGYVDGSNPYTSHWRAKLSACLELYESGPVLRKSICSLLKLRTQPLTMLEAFCALAESDGSQIEALGRLGDPEFLREIKTVCALLPVAEILSRLDGAVSAVDLADLSPNALGKGEALGKAIDKPHGEIFKPISELASLRSLHGATSQTPTAFESRHKLVKPLPEALHTGTGGQLRLHTHVSAKKLPHLDMVQHSPITRARSTKINLKSGAGLASASLSDLNASGSSWFGGNGSLVVPSPADSFPVVEPPALLSPEPLSVQDGSPLPPRGAAPLRSSSPLSFNGSRKSSPKTTGNKSYMRYEQAQAARSVHADSFVSSVGNASAAAAVTPFYSKSYRLASVIDDVFKHSDTSHMLVMCRRDALRAAGEEVLSRSTVEELKEKALKRSRDMLRKFDARKRKHGQEIDPATHALINY